MTSKGHKTDKKRKILKGEIERNITAIHMNKHKYIHQIFAFNYIMGARSYAVGGWGA